MAQKIPDGLTKAFAISSVYHDRDNYGTPQSKKMQGRYLFVDEAAADIFIARENQFIENQKSYVGGKCLVEATEFEAHTKRGFLLVTHEVMCQIINFKPDLTTTDAPGFWLDSVKIKAMNEDIKKYREYNALQPWNKTLGGQPKRSSSRRI